MLDDDNAKARVEDENQADTDPNDAKDQRPASDFIGRSQKDGQKAENGRGAGNHLAV